VLQVGVRLEGDEVGSQQAAQKLLASRQHPEQVRGRKRNVQEEADCGLGRGLAEELGKEHQVVVVHPHLVTRAVVGEDDITKSRVRLHVGLPALGVVDEAGGELVEEGPQGLVRIALVEAAGERRRQIDRDEALPILPARQHLVATLVSGFRSLARPADPEPAASRHHGGERRGQTTGAALLAPALGAALQRQREAIRNDDQLSAGRIDTSPRERVAGAGDISDDGHRLPADQPRGSSTDFKWSA
jgi:hypothetical protein